MRVRELIQLLEQMPQDMEVETEGCDCTALAGKPEVWCGSVMITRGGEDAPTVVRQITKPSLEDLEKEHLK